MSSDLTLRRRDQGNNNQNQALASIQPQHIQAVLDGMQTMALEIAKLKNDRDIGKKIVTELTDQITQLKEQAELQKNENQILSEKTAKASENTNKLTQQIEEIKLANELLTNQMDQAKKQAQEAETQRTLEKQSLNRKLEQLEKEKEKTELKEKQAQLQQALKECDKDLAETSFLGGAGAGGMVLTILATAGAGPFLIAAGAVTAGLGAAVKLATDTVDSQAGQRKDIDQESKAINEKLSNLN